MILTISECMDFESVQKYLESFISYEEILKIPYNERHFNLQRLRVFLVDYGVDYSKLKFVHTAGSKGKGSVATMIANYLLLAGFKVGLYTSPHIVDVRERIWLNGAMIAREDFVAIVADLKKYIDGCVSCDLTYFELLTVVALKYFVDFGVSWAVLEVGLGGRLDATNIVQPKVTVLTTVEKEHADILGDTVEKILNEKLGIVKKGVPLIVGFQTEEVKVLIKQKVREKLIFAEDSDLSFDWNFESLVQEKNAKVAYLVLVELLGNVDRDLFLQMLRDFKLVGRFDVRLIGGHQVVFDMAHTVSSTANLIESLQRKFAGKSFVFLLSFMKGKEVTEMLNLIKPVAKEIVFTASHLERGFSAKELGGVEEDCVSAYEKILAQLKDDQVLVVTGSHFLIAKIISALQIS